DGGAIEAAQLRLILGNLDRETAQAFAQTWAIGALVALRVDAAPDPDAPTPQLFAVSFDGAVSDPELADCTVPAPSYPPFEDSRFGTFTRAGEYASYQASAVWIGRTVTLELDATGPALPQAAAHAAALFDQAQLWQAELDDCLVRDLHSPWNETWKGDRPALARQDWLSRITLTRISIDPTGAFLAYFSDGDLFWGHAIEVSGSRDAGASEARLLG
ncbi:MAG TPA: DUF2262 domain-containing protein, partial [Novosphingobium sp.]|nr:DUF2262 domain-containing protein [Novosphingobium sp.]